MKNLVSEKSESLAVRELLIAVARDRGTVTYGEIASAIGLNIGLSRDRARLVRALHGVCGGEKDIGRPLLGAVVVSKAARIPGKGFFAFSRELGLYAGSDDTGEAARLYHSEELRRVHDTWAVSPAT